MIYIIDHQDSFTWNVVHQFSQFDKVHCSDYFDINKKLLNKSDVIVFSPGPGSPKDYPETSKIKIDTKTALHLRYVSLINDLSFDLIE